MTTTKTQQRAICPACFAQQAVTKGGRLVAHGYRRPQMWHSNVGTCHGAGVPHYGTVAGRDYTTEVARRLRESVQTTFERAYRVEQGSEPVYGRKRIARGVYREVVVENPTAQQRAAYAVALRQQAVAMRASADELDAKVATWSPAEPVVVAVESKATLLHMRRGDRWGGKLCASSAMGAMKGYTTSDAAAVTCDKCKAQMVRQAAKAAAVVAQ